MKSIIKDYYYLLVIALIAFVAAIFGKCLLNKDDYWGGIAVELGGVFWEILLITVILGFYEAKRRKSDKVQELRRRINDFKRLDEDYSKAVIGSALRELKDLGITAPYEFRGMDLSNFSFSNDFGISDISGSIFSDGLYVFEGRNNFTILKNVIFDGTNCKDVVFNKGDYSIATYQNCTFRGSDLTGASFYGACLVWSEDQVIEDENDWISEEGRNADGSPAFLQHHHPPFYNADLNDVIFDKCRFMRADFRGAENIIRASFIHVSGLDTCYFDKGVVEELKAVGRLTEKNS